MIAGGCSEGDDTPNPGPPVQPGGSGKAKVWVTSGDQSRLLAQQNDIMITTIKASPTITLDSTVTYQEIEGFGAALTGSSAYLINKKMSTSQRGTLLQNLFDAENGIGISYLRMTIGASDFSLSDYTYNDMPSGQTDYPLANFSIAKDKEDVVPVLKQIVGIAPNINIMGSPWSAPAWMKTNGSLNGGKLKTDAYESYANYFVKYIKAFDAEGITIDAITPQNEPLHVTSNYPSTDMPAADQLDFVKNNLGPTFESENIDTKIIVYDHNWDNIDYAKTILGDATASQYIAGSAFHAYAGDVSAMNAVHAAYPDKGLYFTEISGGAWAQNFSDNLIWNMNNIFIGTTKNWSKTALLWNLALDENHGPTNGGCADCRGVVTINSGTGSVTKNIEYYSIGHFSKFVRPGAKRIGLTNNQNVAGLNAVAFLNTDGSKAFVALNSTDNPLSIVVNLGARQFSYSLPAKSVATIRW
ncbi:glucan endo-1,6-beta-glucosidase [Pseudochryseolinea flava]|uniref:Glucan endo-1,6-beta-glucosidase n=2 Tax=Pseudochryseolinea flava TaxID=2059302 RepID=A0A364Y6A8_9BACT|nr:glucan endo-1,6-beta-glucosidase [Pseudochryseolinea flava]